MRRLVLVRHAKSSWKDAALGDHERPLNRRGQSDALLIGAHLAQAGLRVDEVLCSSATRAQATWKRIASRWPAGPAARVVPELYLPTLRGLESVLAGAGKDTETLLVVGHSPSLDAFVLGHASAASSALRQRLTAGLPTGSVTVLELRVASFAAIGEARGKVTAFVTPRELGSKRKAPATPVRAERFAISARSTLHELASLAVGSALAQLRGNARGAHAASDPAFAHQQRVGVRKLRVYLRGFEKLVGSAESTRLIGELRWLFRTLGALREHDVFDASQLGMRLARSRASVLAKLAQALELQRTEQQRALQKALSGRRYANLVRDLLALEAELLHTESRGAKRATRWLGKRLGHRLARVQALARRVEPGDAVTLHGLRKELKKLRYTAELGRGAFPHRRVHAFLEQLGELQDELGSWNDAVVGDALLERALHALPARVRSAARRDLAALRNELAPLDRHAPRLDMVQKLEPFWG